MSDDLVKRLLHSANEVYGTHPCGLMSEAADRIEKLEAALRGLDDMIVDLDAGHRELHDVSRFINGALEGWKR